MTDTKPTFCSECDQVVRLEKTTAYGRLKLRCACGTTRSVKVSKALPDGWRDTQDIDKI